MAKNRAVFLFMIFVSLLDMGISGSRGSFVMLLSLLIISAISLFMLVKIYRSLKITEELESSYVMKGEKTLYTIRINQNAKRCFSSGRLVFRPVPMSVDYDYSPVDISLSDNNALILTREISSRYRGVLKPGLDYLDVYDFLGVFKLRKKPGDMPILTVCPNIIQFSDEMFLVSPAEQPGAIRKASSDDYSSVTGIRPYERSDSMKKIHWKLSARKNELQVKNFDTANTTAAGIIIDNRKTAESFRDGAALEDMLIEAAVSIAKNDLDENLPVMADYMETEAVKVYETTSSGFDRIYRAISSISFEGGIIEPVLNDYLNPNFNISAIYLLTIRPDKTIIDFAKAMALKGHNISLFHFFENEEDIINTQLEGSGIFYYGVSSGKTPPQF